MVIATSRIFQHLKLSPVKRYKNILILRHRKKAWRGSKSIVFISNKDYYELCQTNL